MAEKYYTAKEVMKLLNVKCYRTLQTWAERKFLIPIRKPYGRIMYSQSEIDRYLNNFCTYDDPDNDLIDNDNEDDDLLD